MRSPLLTLFPAALALLLLAAPAPRGGAAWAASPVLDSAQQLYDNAKFAEAVTQLRAALSSGEVTGADQIAARALLARCLVKSGARLEAKQAFKFVLRQQPSWRPDPNTAGPDEQEVFQMAQRELTAEQIETGSRIPASLSFSFGQGAGDNKDMAEIAVAGGGKDKYEVKGQIGGSVRFPVAQKWSLEFELQRLRATNKDAFPPPSTALYEITAYPLSLNVYRTAWTGSHLRFNVFAGAGILSSAISRIDLDFGGTPLTISGQKNGSYLQGGLETEVLMGSRLALAGRVLGRSAKADDVLDEFGFSAYGSASLKNREINFSGFAMTLGLRAYIGY
ncbi:MAG: hypothetical protein U0704_06465 [Candidatus Eisenbacteria bacterium]